MALERRSIEDFKGFLQGGGVRPTMFQVEMSFPETVVVDSTQATTEGIFFIKAAQLPGNTIGVIDVPFRGRKLKVSGDRAFDDWNITVTNDVTFRIRKAFEEWSERIQNMNHAIGSNTLMDYFGSAIVRQLDRDGQQLRAYRFEGIWPSNVGAIDLDFDTNDTVEDYDVTLCVQYYSACEVGDPYTAASDPDPSDLNLIST